MKYQVKMKLRKLRSNKTISKVYTILSQIKTKKQMMFSDEDFLKRKFLENTGNKLNLNTPVSFNEKLQWLKINNRKPELSVMVDKYMVRDLVRKKVSSEILIPLVGGPWEKAHDIVLDSLPNQFVLKCNHDCGSVYFCKNKKSFNFNDARKKLDIALGVNYYWVGREWPYKNVKPLIFAEKYMVDESGFELKDYKLHCFGGEVKLIHVDFGRQSVHKRNIYTPDWDYIPMSIQYPTDPDYIIPRPDRLRDMICIAEKLSNGMSYLRVDLYSIGDEIYFGELTIYHGGGMEKFTPSEWCNVLGTWIELQI